MDTSFWLATAYIQAPDQLEQFVALGAFVTDRETFEREVERQLGERRIRFRYQLTPVPGNVFLQRHGRTWLLHQTANLKDNEIRIIPLNDEKPEPVIPADTDYLNRHVIHHVVPLDMQLGRHPKLFAPEEISLLLWPDMPIPPDVFNPEHRDNPPVYDFPKPQIDEQVKQRHLARYGENAELKVYVVLDANKMKFFRAKDYHRCRIKNLFQGEFGEQAAKHAPFLAEVIREEDHISGGELMGLFSSKKALHHPFNWEDKQGIFIHSYADFDTVYHHLRRFPMLQDERGKWFFFRFYDPIVLRNYLEVIAKYPAKLHKFFGYDKSVIYAFGSGYDDTFNYYSLKALPEETMPAPVIMTDWEFEGLKIQRWLNAKQSYLDEIYNHYNNRLTESDKPALVRCLDKAVELQYENPKSIIFYALALFYAETKRIDLDGLKRPLIEQGYSNDEIATLLYTKLK